MTHFICTGDCKGVSGKAGVCEAQDCNKHQEPLTACECTDETHKSTEAK